MPQRDEIYDRHLEYFRQEAHIKGMEQYQRLYRESLENTEEFWSRYAREFLSWFKEWGEVLRYDFEEGQIEWFRGGKINASFNCIDRHMDKIKDRVAFYWEGDRPEDRRKITYGDLFCDVNRMAYVLKRLGIDKGDRVVLYLGMIPELPISMLACARIGAVHSVVFGGFSSEALAGRINDCEAKLLITADGSMRAGKIIDLKGNVDKALSSCPSVEKVIVYRRTGKDMDLGDNQFYLHELLEDVPADCYIEPEEMDSEDSLFILYTSGSTGKPKGMVHTHGGYLLYTAITCKFVFDLRDGDIFWSTADIGWITGHSYGVYGPLINGVSSVLFEGVPTYPDYDRYWDIVERYGVTKFYTAPTVIRSLAREGEEYVKRHDLSSLKILGSVGEPLNPKAWKWYYHNIGRDWCPIMDTWWQTETGGHMLTYLPGVSPIKPGSCGMPFFGVEPAIVDDTGEEVRFPNQEGALCIKRPWPGMARTIFGDHDRFIDTYFSKVPGMYFSGDGAKRDEDGYYWIIGRIDDVINVSGHRLGTAEIESALVLHPLVSEAAVVGFPHAVKGQGIYAFVTLKRGAEKSEELKKELIGLVRSEIGPIATIDVIQWADGLPKTRSGKIMRRILKKIAEGRFEELGDTSTLSDPKVIEHLIEERMKLFS